VHVSVLSKEVLELLRPEKGNVALDSTLGSGGHTEKILKLIGSEGKLIGIDKDNEALERTKKRFAKSSASCEFIHEDFRNIDKVLEGLGIKHIDAALFDLGLSSEQLEDPERGFSFKEDGPLDMRFDRMETRLCAYDFVNHLTEKEIAQILYKFGEERHSRRIARGIVYARKKKPIATTKELADLVLRSTSRGHGWQKIHPATRAFQALRIAVNQELFALEEALDKAIGFLKGGGRICVISFHSLEDRIVKNKFKKLAHEGTIEILTKKPICPTEEEVKENPRARSAKLRAAVVF